MLVARFSSAPTTPAARWTLANIRAAVSRDPGNGHALQPGQALTEQEAVRAATVTAAASLGLPADGLAAGQPADLVVCTGHPFAPRHPRHPDLDRRASWRT
jgi:predicted amidohydrolase YtcJ